MHPVLLPLPPSPSLLSTSHRFWLGFSSLQQQLHAPNHDTCHSDRPVLASQQGRAPPPSLPHSQSQSQQQQAAGGPGDGSEEWREVDAASVAWALHSEARQELLAVCLADADKPSWAELRAAGAGYWLLTSPLLRPLVRGGMGGWLSGCVVGKGEG